MMETMKRLKLRIAACGMDVQNIADCVHRTKSYVHSRINGSYAWTIWEVYQIAKVLQIPWEEVPLYFPTQGGLIYHDADNVIRMPVKETEPKSKAKRVSAWK